MSSPRFVSAKRLIGLLPALAVVAAGLACQQTTPSGNAPWSAANQGTPLALPTTSQEAASSQPMTGNGSDAGRIPPTPDKPHAIPGLRLEALTHVVQGGDTLAEIARKYGVSLEAVIAANTLTDPNWLEVGQELVIPPPQPGDLGPSFKIIPDSELVYGPASVDFDIAAFAKAQGGYLANYQETVEDLDGKLLNGAQIVERVAQQYSVNPRLLLAVLEYQSGWVTRSDPDSDSLDYPIGQHDTWRKGLYRQLAFAANQLNRGYYLWRVDGIGAWILADGSAVPIDPTINAGTAGVQQLLSQLYGQEAWRSAANEQGLFATYNTFFGYPFERAVEPLLPEGIRQPQMQLPFEKGVVWAFTGGPHGGWGDGSAWAALDFAPSSEALGCAPNDAWVVAAADGLIVRAENGEVLQDLDGDGHEQTGWAVLYMHVETRGRVAAGTFVHAGEHIGHPSCEGGVSTGTHLHLARRYNGEWIPADQKLPFVLDGWASRGTGTEYDGLLESNDRQIEAWNGISPENSIQR